LAQVHLSQLSLPRLLDSISMPRLFAEAARAQRQAGGLEAAMPPALAALQALSGLVASAQQERGNSQHQQPQPSEHVPGGAPPQPPARLTGLDAVFGALGRLAQVGHTGSAQGLGREDHGEALQGPIGSGPGLDAVLGALGGLANRGHPGQAPGVQRESDHGSVPQETSRDEIGHSQHRSGDQSDSAQQPHPLLAFGDLVAGVSQAVAASGGIRQERGTGGQRSQGRGSESDGGFDAPAFAAGVGQAAAAVQALQGPMQEFFGNANQQSDRSGRRRGIGSRAVDANTVTVVHQGRSSREGTDSSADSENRCVVCCEDFQCGEQLRVLPCFHKFHCACIDPWLRQSGECPICKHRVV